VVLAQPAKTPQWFKEVPTKTVAYYAVNIESESQSVYLTLNYINSRLHLGFWILFWPKPLRAGLK
jgi:hypothetical protein